VALRCLTPHHASCIADVPLPERIYMPGLSWFGRRIGWHLLLCQSHRNAWGCPPLLVSRPYVAFAARYDAHQPPVSLLNMDDIDGLSVPAAVPVNGLNQFILEL
jgi:hypothetical protein